MNNKCIRLYLDIQDQKRPVPKKNFRLRSRLLEDMFGIIISPSRLERTTPFKVIYKKTNRSHKFTSKQEVIKNVS